MARQLNTADCPRPAAFRQRRSRCPSWKVEDTTPANAARKRPATAPPPPCRPPYFAQYLDANSINTGQFGAGVCPPACCRNARSPSISAVSIGGKLEVFSPFLPSNRYTGPAATVARNIPLRRSGSDKHRPRRAQRDQLMRIDWQIFRRQWPRVFQKIPRHPVILARSRHVLQLLPKIPPVKFRSALAGRTDVCNRESRVVSHRHQRRFPVTRMAGDPDPSRIYRGVALEVVQRAARSPGPRAKRSPVVEFARLSAIGNPDDSTRKSPAVVFLNTRGNERRVTPAFGQELLLPRGSSLCAHQLRKSLRQ